MWSVKGETTVCYELPYVGDLSFYEQKEKRDPRLGSLVAYDKDTRGLLLSYICDAALTMRKCFLRVAGFAGSCQSNREYLAKYLFRRGADFLAERMWKVPNWTADDVIQRGEDVCLSTCIFIAKINTVYVPCKKACKEAEEAYKQWARDSEYNYIYRLLTTRQKEIEKGIYGKNRVAKTNYSPEDNKEWTEYQIDKHLKRLSNLTQKDEFKRVNLAWTTLSQQKQRIKARVAEFFCDLSKNKRQKIAIK